MQGEHRPALSEYMWAHAQTTLLHPTNSNLRKSLTNEQVKAVKITFDSIKTQDDITNKVRQILHSYTDVKSIRKVTDTSDEIFLKTLFSFHPTREIPSDSSYPILVGPCHGQTTFYV